VARSELAVIVFTDIVGSTWLHTRVGDHAADRLRRIHDRLLCDVVVRHHGRVVKGVGNGITAAFTGAGDAPGSMIRPSRGSPT